MGTQYQQERSRMMLVNDDSIMEMDAVTPKNKTYFRQQMQS